MIKHSGLGQFECDRRGRAMIRRVRANRVVWICLLLVTVSGCSDAVHLEDVWTREQPATIDTPPDKRLHPMAACFMGGPG